jgi:hypothetical protein
MKIKRFSNNKGSILESIDNRTNQALNLTESVSSKLINDENLGKSQGVKRWGRFVNNLSKLAKRKKRESQ